MRRPASDDNGFFIINAFFNSATIAADEPSTKLPILQPIIFYSSLSQFH